MIESKKKKDGSLCKKSTLSVFENWNSKKVFWQNTNHWNELLMERAEITGKLVLSDFTKNALANFSNK